MSSVAFLYNRSSKCTKIVGDWDFAPDTTRKLTALRQTPSLGFRGLLLRPLLLGENGRWWAKTRGKDGRKGGAKMICAPGAGNPCATTDDIELTVLQMI